MRRRRPARALVALACIVTMTGCGGADEDSSPTTPDSSSTAPSSASASGSPSGTSPGSDTSTQRQARSLAAIPGYAKGSGLDERAFSIRRDGGLRVSVVKTDLRAQAYFSGRDVDVVEVPRSVDEVDAVQRRVDAALRDQKAPGLFAWGPLYDKGYVQVSATQVFWSSGLGRTVRGIDGVHARVADPSEQPSLAPGRSQQSSPTS